MLNADLKKQVDELILNLPISYETVILSYSGSGDSGDINSTIVYTIDKKSITPPDEECGKIADILLDSIVECYYGGWENNDGAEGTVELDIKNKQIKISHSEFYTECNTTELEESF